MKDALYYALRRKWGSDFGVVAITTEKRSHWWGRNSDGEATHGALYDLYGRFPTMGAADAVINDMKAIKEKFAPRVKELSDALSALYVEETQVIDALIKSAAHV